MDVAKEYDGKITSWWKGKGDEKMYDDKQNKKNNNLTIIHQSNETQGI